MTQTAYTLGSKHGYDQSLRVAARTGIPSRKLGQRLDEEPPYQGGWIFVDKYDANAFRYSSGFERAFPDRHPAEFAVYELALPNGIDTDFSPEPFEDGVHRLLNDAVIVGRAA